MAQDWRFALFVRRYEAFAKAADFLQRDFFFLADIGQWNPNGTLSIIDRRKNLVKLAGGEYIALERLECVPFPRRSC